MLYFARGFRVLLIIVLLTTLVPAAAWAGEPDLRLPTIAASAAAAADWASTYHALKNYQVREVNPLLRPFDSSPAKVVSLGAALDMAGISGWNMAMGRKHPTLAAAGLWAMAGFRTYLALHNLHNERLSARR